MLTTTDGLNKPLADGRSERISFLREISKDVLKFAHGKGGDISTGGMASKLESARLKKTRFLKPWPRRLNRRKI
jgi:glutamate 5-kinase